MSSLLPAHRRRPRPDGDQDEEPASHGHHGVLSTQAKAILWNKLKESESYLWGGIRVNSLSPYPPRKEIRDLTCTLSLYVEMLRRCLSCDALSGSSTQGLPARIAHLCFGGPTRGLNVALSSAAAARHRHGTSVAAVYCEDKARTECGYKRMSGHQPDARDTRRDFQ
ncbi:hypothetical protein GWK47_026194 [Chionoecetes opilio]|uniref:Uncharacterized protein n=1 Tax=Chionoecetes opilio TaxID=41210 RepID=A0A8J8WMV4_CHIOP|nr:hypothetical protein GWK47_026194 [Chionoecetes opilio]